MAVRLLMPPVIYLFLLCTAVGASPQDPNQIQARIQYAVMPGEVKIRIHAPVALRAGDKSVRLEIGEWTLLASDLRPARQRFHVFPKTFQPNELIELTAYLDGWRSRGYDPQIETLGLLFKTSSGRIFDNRVHWVSLARFETASEAEALIGRLRQEPVWAWMRAETVAPGSAVFRIRDAAGQLSEPLPGPIEMAGTEPFELIDVSSSFWKDRKANRFVLGPLDFAIGPDGKVEVYGRLPIETYLRGVVPAEMPAGWPAEALKAQAIVARSEIYASLATKYRLEGFDFTALEGCRAYWGIHGHHPSTDQAVMETAGQAIVRDGKFVQTVFSACCGGWTENNEYVWAGPPNAALRGVADLSGSDRAASAGPSGNPREWIVSRPKAWCASDETGFRWQRRFTVKELSDIVNKRHRVGTISGIQEGQRGVSGRLRSVTITGNVGSVVVERELAIRQAFGGLPSAMFVVGATPGVFTFYGGGRGHGVGMCQHGARGMAAAGRKFDEIVVHYFNNVALERMR